MSKKDLKVEITQMPLTLEANQTQPSLWKRIKTLFLEVKQTFKATGFKGLFRTYGWKIFAAFFVYYLIRDVTLYIVLPWLVARHLINS